MKKLNIHDNFPERLSEFIKKELKITQIDFAKKIGITAGYLSMVITKKSGPSAELIAGLYIHYNEYMDWLLTGEEDKKTEKISNSSPDDPPELKELLDGARKVLTSGNPIAFDALERNIRYFSHAIEVEKRMKDMEADVAEMKRYVLELKKQEEAREKACLEEQSSRKKVA